MSEEKEEVAEGGQDDVEEVSDGEPEAEPTTATGADAGEGGGAEEEMPSASDDSSVSSFLSSVMSV